MGNLLEKHKIKDTQNTQTNNNLTHTYIMIPIY